MKRMLGWILLSTWLLSGCIAQDPLVVHAQEWIQTATGSASRVSVEEQQEINAINEQMAMNEAFTDVIAYSEPHQTVRLGPIELTVNEIELLGNEKYGEESKKGFGEAIKSDYIVQFEVLITNNGEESVTFTPAGQLLTGGGELVTGADLFSETMTGKWEAGETRSGQFSFLITQPGFEQVALQTDHVYDLQGNRLSNGEQIEIHWDDYQ